MAHVAYYSPALRAEFVELPDALITFFKQLGHYYVPLRGLDAERRAVTYRHIVGNNATQIPAEYANSFDLIANFDSYPLENKDPASADEADEAAVQALKFMYGSNHFRILNKAYMINTSSLPIRVRFTVNGRDTHPIYVKRPNTDRLIGKFMYDIISGFGPTRYCFNRAVFIEEGLPGNILWNMQEERFIDNLDYRVGLARAAAHAQVLGVADVCERRNRILDSQLRTMLFDFNLIFVQSQEPEDPNFLLRPYVKKDHQFMNLPWVRNKTLANAYTEELFSIGERIDHKHRIFFKLCRIAGELRNHTGKSLDERVKEWHGDKSFEAFFERRVKDLRFYR